MSQYRYAQLSPTSIRLLRLLPSAEDPKSLRCELFEHPLQYADKPSHPYEALSYVWGSEDKPHSIIIENQELHVTRSLYAALSRLQGRCCSRVIWVDAICIDQVNDREKAEQIPLMAEIYAKASRVVVWLGEAGDASHHALEVLRLIGEKTTKLSNVVMFRAAILQLLQRPWFQRIWILQEMAAAHHILIICGYTEIDGHAFCLGLDFLCEAFSFTTPASFLIRGAIFRSRNMSRKQGRISLDICSLGELVDMYHSHKATKLHDKVYALLGMCSDDLSAASLEPNYTLPWRVLMKRLVKFLIGSHASINTWDNKEIAIIKSKGSILGKVSTVVTNVNVGGGQTLEVIFGNTSKQLRHEKNGTTRLTLPISAKPIQKGDLICLLHGASKPTIIRLREDHFVIVLIAANPPEHLQTENGVINWPELPQSAPFTRDFLLVWDWAVSQEGFQDSRKYDVFMRTNNLQLEDEIGFEGQLSNVTRIWYVSLILGDLGEYKKAEETLKAAVDGYKRIFRKEPRQPLKSRYGLTPLAWAAGNGYDTIVNLLLTKVYVNIDLKDSEYDRTPLSWAAGNGHGAVVKLLLETGKVDVDSKDNYDRTPLWQAAEKGHEAVVKLLLETDQVDVNSKDCDGSTPLWWAARNGHEAVVKLLLETGQADVDSKGSDGRVPLWWAAANGYEAVVKLLLKTGKVNVDSKDCDGGTLLWWAADYGHEAVVKLLLETGRVDVDLKASDDRTPLWRAAKNGHEAVVKLLLETGKVDVDLKDSDGRTPLWRAAEDGHEAVVKLLLETGKVDVDLRDRYGWTPLSRAARNVHETVVKLLLETGKVDVDSKDSDGQTPLSQAAKNGHETVVKLLLDVGKVDVDSKDKYGRTPLSQAAGKGHEAVIKLLLETSKVGVDLKDSDGQTPLWWAARNGHEAVMKLLLETGKVDVDSKGSDGLTPLSHAVANGYEAVVKLLLETGKVDADSKDNHGQTPL